MRKLLLFFTCLSILLCNQTTNTAYAYSNSFDLSDSSINIDGDFSDWDNYPASYEYNWDNSSNCWEYGVWVDGQCYKTEQGTYSTDVRHKMQLHCDGEYVYLHIVFSRDYYAGFNGECYQFGVDGNTATFNIQFQGGGTITNNLGNVDEGVYEVEVNHSNGGLNTATGATAYLQTNKNNLNNEIEMCIPLSELEKQNNSINSDTASVISFNNPNLMYRDITMAGTSTGPTWLAVCCVGIVGLGFFLRRKKNNVI